jgi:rod shape-determining protein MreD
LWAWKLFGLIIIPLTLQTSVFPQISYLGVVPNLLLLLTICYGLLQGIKPGVYFGLIAGFCLDLAAGGILGINILLLGLLGLAAGYLERVVFKGNILVPLLSALAGTLFYEFFGAALQSSFGWRMEFWSFLVSTVLPLCLYHLVLVGPVYLGMNKALNLLREKFKVGG